MPRPCRIKRILWLLLISAAALLLCSKTSPLYVLNDWMDANIFYTMGKSMFSGRVLYRDAFDHKGPVLYLLYGLGWLADRTGFTGVFLLQVVFFALFLALGLQSVQLLLGRPLHPAWAALPAAVITASRAYSHGGSAEELLLPFLGAALYAALRAVVRADEPLPLRTVLWQGMLAGCALWLKYTVLGFYLVWVVLLAAVYARRGRWALLGKSCAVYLGGMALATLPWVVYFGINGALGDWFTAYFYDNLFLYTGTGTGPVELARHLWWAVYDAAPTALLIGAFLLWAACFCRPAALCAVPLLAGLALTSLMGGYLVYYGLVLAVFAPLGVAPLAWAAARLRLPQAARSAAPWAAAMLCAVCCFAFSPNRALRFRRAEDLPQIRFAETINADPDASLLNYGTLDGGFYTATGLPSPCRYFCVTNMPLPEQQQQQSELLNAGAVRYAVAVVSDLDLQFPRYEKIDQCSYDGGEGTATWYLYRLKNS